MLDTFDIDSAQLIVGDLSLLQLKITLQVFNDPTHDRLIPQPSHAYINIIYATLVPKQHTMSFWYSTHLEPQTRNCE